jgi:hypothetical protein
MLSQAQGEKRLFLLYLSEIKKKTRPQLQLTPASTVLELALSYRDGTQKAGIVLGVL